MVSVAGKGVRACPTKAMLRVVLVPDVLGRVLPGDGSVDVWTRWQGSRNACRLDFGRIGEVVWDKSGASAKMAVARRLGKAVRTVTGKATA